MKKLLPNYYPLVRIKSVRDESSLVSEHLKLHDKEFVIMAKHFNDPPYRHEMRVVGGDIKGSYIIEKIIPIQIEPRSPNQADWVQWATAAATKAPPSIFPSSPKSITPERSAKIPPIAASTKGTEMRSVPSKISKKSFHISTYKRNSLITKLVNKAVYIDLDTTHELLL